MLSEEQINQMGMAAAAAHLPPGALVRVVSRPAIGTDGEPMLRVRFVVKAELFPRITGEHSVDALLDLQDRLQAAGEERFASIDYATDAELAENGGS